MKMSKKSKIVIYILLGLVAIYFLAPFIYMLFSAFKTEGEAIAYPPKLLPAEWHFENFINAWKSQPFGTYLWNSILVTVLTTVGQVLSCSLVAYPLYDPAFNNDDSMGCYHDSAVHGIQLIRMDQYTEAADRAGMVRICLLCIPDETVPHGNPERF
mgnify:CR=1 FL=1